MGMGTDIPPKLPTWKVSASYLLYVASKQSPTQTNSNPISSILHHRASAQLWRVSQ